MKPQEKFELYRMAYKRAEDPAWYTRPLGQAAIAGGAAGLAGALTGKDLRSAIRRALGFGGAVAALTYGGRKGYDHWRANQSRPLPMPDHKATYKDPGEEQNQPKALPSSPFAEPYGKYLSRRPGIPGIWDDASFQRDLAREIRQQYNPPGRLAERQ